MAHELIKPQVLADTAVGLAVAQAQLIHTVWRELETYYHGEYGPDGDTVSLRFPTIIGNAKDLGWRDQDRSIKTETIKQRKVDFTLDSYPYQAVDLLREEKDLDIAQYGAQVLRPMVNDVVEWIEDKTFQNISGTTFHETVEIKDQDRALYKAVVEGNEFLDSHGVPADRRWLVIGTGLNMMTKLDDSMLDANRSGSDQLLRRGEIGILDGMNVMVSRRIGKYDAYMYHPTAFPAALRAPAPSSAVWNAYSTSHDGIALTYWESHNSDRDSDRAFVGTYMGSGRLLDPLDPKKPKQNLKMLRAVKLDGSAIETAGDTGGDGGDGGGSGE